MQHNLIFILNQTVFLLKFGEILYCFTFIFIKKEHEENGGVNTSNMSIYRENIFCFLIALYTALFC